MEPIQPENPFDNAYLQDKNMIVQITDKTGVNIVTITGEFYTLTEGEQLKVLSDLHNWTVSEYDRIIESKQKQINKLNSK